jgi:enterochelin esterase family protein
VTRWLISAGIALTGWAGITAAGPPQARIEPASPAISVRSAYPAVFEADCFATARLPPLERAKAEEWLLGALDREGLYTVATGLKPLSSGVRAFRFSATAPDLSEVDEARRIVSVLQCGEGLTSFVHQFAVTFEGERSAEIMLVHRPAFDRVLEEHRGFFAPHGLSPGIPPAQALAIVESLPRADRYRALGYLFGFPDYAVDFFVKATAPEADAGPGKDREFFSVPVYRGNSGSFVWAVPLGHQTRPEDRNILDQAADVLSAYTSLRARFVDDSPGQTTDAGALLREWFCDGSRMCGVDRVSVQMTAGSRASRSDGPAYAAPDAQADGRATFRLQAPAAREVTLWGEWMPPGRTLPLSRDREGTWSLDVGPLEAGPYLYAFNVDGLRVADPANRRVKSGYPGLASVVDLPGDLTGFAAIRPLPHGTVHVERYRSGPTGAMRRAHIYTPPGFDANARRRYPTAFLLHGSWDNDNDWLELGRAGIILDNLLAAGRVEPMILVMPDGHPFPSFDTKTRAQNLALLRAEILDVLIPLVERSYRASPRPDDRAIVGLSMGGVQALHIGLGALNRFGSIGALSAPGDLPLGPSLEEAWGATLADARQMNRLRLFWLACGRDDELMPLAREVRDTLARHNVRHIWRETEGDHNWIAWRRHWLELAPRLFR